MLNIQITGESILARFQGNEDEPMINNCLKNKLGPAVRLTNTAISGNNTFDMLTRIEKDILSVPTSNLIFILIGTNDLALHKQVSLSQFKENLRQIIEKLLTKYPAHHIFLISPPPVDESKQKYRKNVLIFEYVSIMKEVAENFSCYFIDLYQTFFEIGHLPTLMKGIRDDGLHFGIIGYQILAEQIVAALNEEKFLNPL